MTAPKKSNPKSKVSPAPATKPSAPKPAARKKSVTPTKVVAVAPSPAAATTPVAQALAVPAPVSAKPVALQPEAHHPIVTTITARIDVGFGNTLYIRGEGTGLSWDAGVPMECVGNDLWRTTLGESRRGFTFKFLINDLTWNTGPDYTAVNGADVTLTPEF